MEEIELTEIPSVGIKYKKLEMRDDEDLYKNLGSIDFFNDSLEVTHTVLPKISSRSEDPVGILDWDGKVSLS